MANHTDDISRAKLIITLGCIVALVFVTGFKIFAPELQIDNFFYAIIAGILFGVGGIREIFGVASNRDKGDNKKDKE